MKYLSAIILSFFIQQNAFANSSLSSNQSSSNISQQTGGNYIYAENGKLTFNLEPSLFNNRSWQFNNQVDGAVTAFETKLPIKTKNSSSFYAYELAMGYHVYEYTADTGEMKFVRSTTDKPPKGELMYPVYTPRIDKGRTYHVWLPAAVWTVRIIGTIARQVLPPIITRAATACATNSMCVTVAIVSSAHAAGLCAINYYNDGVIRKFLHLPKTVCEKADEQGWKANQDPATGETNAMSKTYPYTVTVTYGSYDLHQKCPECDNDYRVEKFGAESFEEAEAMLNKKCKSINTYTDKVENSEWYLLSGTVKEIDLKKGQGGSYSCSGIAIDDEYNEEFHVSAFTASIENSSFTENMQIHDINDLIMEDFKKDPTPYINDNGQVGKELRDNIKSSAAIQKTDGTSGTLNATSEPYIDPNSGRVVQDILTVDSGTSDFTLPPMSGGGGGSSGGSGSGGTSSGTTGIPTGTNNVTVSTIERPDLTNEAKPAENNNPNGTGVGTGTSSTGETSQGEESKPQAASGVGGLDCEKEHKGTLACAKLGDVSESDFDGIEIPNKTESITYSEDNFLPTNGVCPAPKIFHVVGKPYEVGYEPICSIASDIRFAVLIAFAVMAALVAFGGLRKS